MIYDAENVINNIEQGIQTKDIIFDFPMFAGDVVECLIIESISRRIRIFSE
jgi:uncharacterized protein (DUF433 family)